MKKGLDGDMEGCNLDDDISLFQLDLYSRGSAEEGSSTVANEDEVLAKGINRRG